MIHGQPDRAHEIVAEIERSVIGKEQAQRVWPKIKLKMRSHTPLGEVAHTLFHAYRQRSLVGLALMIAQAFFYNAIFFTYALVLTDFFGIAVQSRRLVPAAVRGRQFSGPAAARTAVRHARTAHHDRADLRRFRRPAGAVRLSVRDRRAERADPDHRLDGDFLLCLARGERRLSHRQRDLSAGSPRAGDRAVLCHRHRNRRRGGAGAARRADRYRLAEQRFCRVSSGVGLDDRGRLRSHGVTASPPSASRWNRLHGRWLLWSNTR